MVAQEERVATRRLNVGVIGVGVGGLEIIRAMVQQPDPKFHSAMPIVRPNAGEGATFAMNIVRVPSCKTNK